MHNLEVVLRERISGGLKRKTVNSCGTWAESYRVMGQPFPGPWKFDHHPWLREMHDCEAESIAGQKAAQMGYTECALNKAFKAIDIDGISVLYILPAAKPDASDFSNSRFDPALEMSPHLENLFTSVKNIGHKRAGNANLYIRGSRSRSQLKSIPVGLIIADELDEMDQANVSLAEERSSGQLQKQDFKISTPTIDNFGINAYYRQSTQDHYYFRCPSCGKQTELIYPECLVITAEDITDKRLRDSHIICKECKNKLPSDLEGKRKLFAKAKWVSTYTDRHIRGFYINQMYSMTVRPWELAAKFINAQNNPADEQEFYNSKLGIPHIVEGARITDVQIEACMGGHKMFESSPGGLITMGVDVGKWLHYEIDQWFTDSKGSDIHLSSTCKIIKSGKVLDFEELDGLMAQFGIHFAVIDAHPEKRKALEFAQRFWGRVRLCFYGRGIASKVINLHAEEEHTMTVDRTTWLDTSLGRFKSKKILLPINISVEFKNHIKALVRVYQKDKDGNPIGKYVKGNDDDHFAHARNYAELALQLGSGIGTSQNIGGVV